jgi:uncharacterized protein (DUF1778 family)
MQICGYISLTKFNYMKTQQQSRDMRVSARVTEKEYNKLTKLAKQHKTSVADYMRQALLG